MKKLSICMPCYNQWQFTEAIIKNIQQVCQFIDYELLICDDCSRDQTPKVIEELADKNTKYRRFEKNAGVTKSRNRLVKQAEGEYIVVINNDMLFPHNFFEKMIAGFIEKDTMLVCPRYYKGTLLNKTGPFYFHKHIFGSCFMLKQEDKNKLFPLDTRMKIFGSDNWLYQHLKYNLKGNLKLKVDAVCHHFVSQTSIGIENIDRPIYLEICKQNGWNIVPVSENTDTPCVDLLF